MQERHGLLMPCTPLPLPGTFGVRTALGRAFPVPGAGIRDRRVSSVLGAGRHGRAETFVSCSPCQCSASGKAASGKARSKVALAGSPQTAWKRWRTAHRRESKVIHPRVPTSPPLPLPMGAGSWCPE